MPGVGPVGRARPALRQPHRCSAWSGVSNSAAADPLPVCRLSLASPARQWLVPLARSADRPCRHPAGIAPVLGWHSPGSVAIPTPVLIAAEPRAPRLSEVSRPAPRCLGLPGRLATGRGSAARSRERLDGQAHSGVTRKQATPRRHERRLFRTHPESANEPTRPLPGHVSAVSRLRAPIAADAGTRPQRLRGRHDGMS